MNDSGERLRPLMVPTYHARLIEMTYAVLGLMVLLTIAAFYLSATAQINAFPSYVVGLTMIALLVLSPSVVRHIDLRLLGSLLAVLGYQCLSVLWADNGRVASSVLHLGYATLILSFVYGIVLLQMHYAGFIRFLIWFVVLAAVVSATYSIQLHFAYPEFQPLKEDRLFALGRLHNPVVGAFSYGIAMVMALHLIIRGDAANDRLLAGFSLMILTIAVVLTHTRSVWIGLVAAALVAIAAYLPESRRRQLLAVGLLLIVVSALVVGSMGWAEFIKRSTSFRPEIWQHFIGLALDGHWLLGLGMDTDTTYVHEVVYTFQHPHSVFVATFFFGGVTGLALFVGTLGLFIQRLVTSRRSGWQVLALMLLAFSLSISFFDGNKVLEKVSFSWIVFWLPVATSLIAIQEGSSDAPGASS